MAINIDFLSIQLLTPSVIFGGLSLSIIAAFLYFVRSTHTGKPRLIPGVHVVGVNNGQTLEAARERFVFEADKMFEEGHKATGGDLFYVPSTMGERLMIPTRYLSELKNSSDSEVDFTASFVEMFAGDYTTIGKRWDLHPRIIKGSLNAHLEHVIPAISDEIQQAFIDTLPPCEDWTTVPVADTVRLIIARASSRMMGGLQLSRNSEWLETSVSFTTNAWMAAQRLKTYPSWSRGAVQYLLPEMTALRTNMKIAQKVIEPIVRSRMLSSDIEHKKPVDLLQMTMEGAEGSDRTPYFLAYTMLAVAFAAIHTSSSVPTHIVYDLCAYPQFVETLREEAQSVLAKHRSWTRAALNELVKLDSFLKESQRFNPLVFMTFGRVIHKDLTLHDGLTIPAHTVIGIPSHAINHSPEHYPRPERFEPFRFLKTDDKPLGGGAPKSFVSTSAFSMSWGYGKHACSGRFFAADEIKIVVATLLLEYEFKFAEGVKGRPRNMSYELQNSPDPSVPVLMRRRRA